MEVRSPRVRTLVVVHRDYDPKKAADAGHARSSPRRANLSPSGRGADRDVHGDRAVGGGERRAGGGDQRLGVEAVALGGGATMPSIAAQLSVCAFRAGRCGRMADVPEDPTAIKQLDLLLKTATIAHEAIFEIRRERIAADQGNPEQAQLLEESARIVTFELPGLSAAAR
jgi:hypothetical protein